MVSTLAFVGPRKYYKYYLIAVTRPDYWGGYYSCKEEKNLEER